MIANQIWLNDALGDLSTRDPGDEPGWVRYVAVAPAPAEGDAVALCGWDKCPHGGDCVHAKVQPQGTVDFDKLVCLLNEARCLSPRTVGNVELPRRIYKLMGLTPAPEGWSALTAAARAVLETYDRARAEKYDELSWAELRDTPFEYLRAALAVQAPAVVDEKPAAWIRWEWNRSGRKSLEFFKPDELSLADEARGVVYDPLYGRPLAPLPKGWKFNHAQQQTDDDGPVDGVWEIGFLDPEDDRFSPIVTVDAGLYYQDKDAEPLARAILARLATSDVPVQGSEP